MALNSVFSFIKMSDRDLKFVYLFCQTDTFLFVIETPIRKCKHLFSRSEHRYLWTEPYVAPFPPFFLKMFLTSTFFHINNILRHTVIHRKLQNVVYMRKKLMGGNILKKKKEKKGEQHRVLSTSTCGSEHLQNVEH